MAEMAERFPAWWKCKNKTTAKTNATESDTEKDIPKPKSHILTVFPSKVDIGKICGGVGSRAVAACLAAKAARRSKIAALSAIEAAKKGDIGLAAKMLAAAAMGKTGKADQPDSVTDDDENSCKESSTCGIGDQCDDDSQCESGFCDTSVTPHVCAAKRVRDQRQ